MEEDSDLGFSSNCPSTGMHENISTELRKPDERSQLLIITQ
jgi:hypothetical protein